MGLFHKHVFKESTTKPGILFCECGKLKCLHDYKEKGVMYQGSIFNHRGERVGFDSKIYTYECSICKDIKREYV